MSEEKSMDAMENEISNKKTKKGRKSKKGKKPKPTPKEKAIKKKGKIEKQSAVTIKRAQDRVKKAEQAIKNVEKSAQKKEKDKEKKAANKIKKEEKKLENKEKRRAEKKEQKFENKALKKERKIEKKAERIQHKAELAARTPLQKKAARRMGFKKFLLKLLILLILVGLILAGVKFAPLVLEKIDLPKINLSEMTQNIKEKIPFLNKEKAEQDEEQLKEKEKEQDKEQQPEEVMEDDPTLYISGTSVLEEFYTEALAQFLDISKKDAKLQAVVSDTYNSYTNLINGDEQVIFASFPTDKENKMAEMAGVDLQPIPIMNSGFVFFVSKDNPVKSLTATQLYNIYSGTITNWKELGGKDQPIIAYQRTENSGSQTGMYKYVINKDEITKVSEDMQIAETKEIIKTVNSNSGSIGYSYYYYIENSKNQDDVKLIGVNGVKPTRKTIATAEYPLTTYSYAIIVTEENTKSLSDIISSVDKKVDEMKAQENEKKTDEEVAVEESTQNIPEELPLKLKFIEWILSKEGQKLVEENGFIRHDDK